MTQATYAKFASEVSDIKEQVELEQIKDDLYYSGTINELLGINSAYNDKLILQEGELVYVSSNVSSKEAKWFEQLGILKSSDYFTVEFDAAGGSETESQSIKAGKTAKQPKNPTKEGYEFDGWYYVKESGTEDNPIYEEIKFDFNTNITSNITLYAKYFGEAVLMPRNSNTAFWQSTYRTKITSILFKKDNIVIPENVLNWDIQANSNCARIVAYIQDDGNNGYILTIVSPYTIYANVNTFAYFRDFSNVKSISFDNFDTSKCYSMLYMFYNCESLTNLNISNFNTNNVTNITGIFFNCKKLESLYLSNKFKTDKVTKMNSMFYDCQSLINIDVSNFNTSNVTDMYAMFRGCENITTLDLSSFDTSKVTRMTYMFLSCKELTTIYVSEKWTTGNVSSSTYMFRYNTKLEGSNGTSFSGSHTNKEYARIDTNEAPGYFTAK